MTKFSKFLLTSVLTTGIYLIVLYVLTDIAGIWYMLSAVLTSAMLTIIGFTVNYLWTWHRRGDTKYILTSRFLKYIVVGTVVAVVTWVMLYSLTEFANLYYLLSAVIVWVIGTIMAFLANNYWTYKD